MRLGGSTGLLTLSSVFGSLLICTVLFVDVPVPFFGTVIRFAMIPCALLLIFGGPRVKVARLLVVVLCIPFYFLLPWLLDRYGIVMTPVAAMVEQLVMAGVAVLVAREVFSSCSRRFFADVFILFAVTSGVTAFAQRYDVIGPMGRDVWGRAATASGHFRGAGFLTDPNFLGVLLAASVPLIFHWGRGPLRPIALVAVTAGIFGTDSRAGLVLLLISVAFVSFDHVQSMFSGASSRLRGGALLGVAALILVIVTNVGGQRDRVLDGVQAALSGTTENSRSDDSAADLSAVDRREFAEAWFHLGMNSLPFGAGLNGQDFIVTESGKHNAAHNNFIQMFGQGGVFGLIIVLVTIESAFMLFRRRDEEFSLTGLVVIFGGLFLSYPGSLLMLFPIGIADGMAAQKVVDRGARKADLRSI